MKEIKCQCGKGIAIAFLQPRKITAIACISCRRVKKVQDFDDNTMELLENELANRMTKEATK